MTLNRIASVVLAALLLTGTAAALPAAASSNDHASDAADAPDEVTDRAGDGAAQAPVDAGPGERGPPTDLPGAVPDFVGDVHEAIRQHIAGTLEGSLGDVVSDLTPDDAESHGDGTDGEETANDSEATDDGVDDPSDAVNETATA